jgi:hypothetical protein
MMRTINQLCGETHLVEAQLPPPVQSSVIPADTVPAETRKYGWRVTVSASTPIHRHYSRQGLTPVWARLALSTQGGR